MKTRPKKNIIHSESEIQEFKKKIDANTIVICDIDSQISNIQNNINSNKILISEHIKEKNHTQNTINVLSEQIKNISNLILDENDNRINEISQLIIRKNREQIIFDNILKIIERIGDEIKFIIISYQL